MISECPRAAVKLVLVVEDDGLLRSLMVQAIQELGFETVDFDSADDALLYVMQNSDDISLIVSDYTLPGQLDGGELAELVCNRYPFISFILTTGHGDLSGVFQSGIKFLLKPWAVEHLEAAIFELMEIQQLKIVDYLESKA